MAPTTVTVKWLDRLRAEAQSEDGIGVDVSAVRNYGEGTAVSPMELLLVSLASCSMLATVSILESCWMSSRPGIGGNDP